MFFLRRILTGVAADGRYVFLRHNLSFYLNFSFSYSTKLQSFNISKDKFIKLLNEALQSHNIRRLGSLIVEGSDKLNEILNCSLKLVDKNGLLGENDDVGDDFLQSYDILILWRSMRLMDKFNDKVKKMVEKLLIVTQMQLSGFSFIRLALVLHQISQLFSNIENVSLLDRLNVQLTLYHLSQLSGLEVDSHSLCLLFNYVASTPFHDFQQYVDMSNAFLTFMDIYSRQLKFTCFDYLFIYKSSNKLYQRYKDSRITNIAVKSINSYINTCIDINLSQIIRLFNQLFSNFNRDELTINYNLYKELINNILKIIKLHGNNLSPDLNKKTVNLIKRVNKLSLG